MPGECAVDIIQEEDGLCINTGEANISCSATDSVGPYEGVCAPKGPSCHRSSNPAKECLLGPDDDTVMELRINQTLTENMPYSPGILESHAITRSVTCSSEQCLLMRFTVPREGGERGVRADSRE
jgi:hypothetical protein